MAISGGAASTAAMQESTETAQFAEKSKHVKPERVRAA